MKIVIEIDDDTYKDIKQGKIYSSVRDVPQESVSAISHGTPLPKVHGRLIDSSDLVENLFEMCDECGTLAENPYRDNPHIDSILDVIENMPTIIPSDEGAGE